MISGIALFSGLNAQKTHTVVKGDNPYNIAKKYGLTLDDLVKMNPSAKDGKLNIGDVVVVGKKNAPAATPAKKVVTEKPVSSSATGKIILLPKQTIYGITKQYHISEADLRRLNPQLDNNMKIGSEIVLPMENIRKYAGSQPVATVVETPASTTTVVNSSDSYEVQAKDNYYRISKKFNLTQQQLFALNPGLEARGLQPGDVIKVKGNAAAAPVQNTAKEPVRTAVADDYVTYTVKDGDTVFGILNRFGVSLDQLLDLNPNLTNGLKPGMVLKIKKLDQAYVKTSGDALNVVMMLPFGFDSNDTKMRSMSADFLAGAKLAIERNARMGQKLNVKVIDAGNEASFKNSLTQINQDNTDLIVGPFLKSNILEVLNFVEGKKIPVVAPFANAEELYNYSNLIIAEPGDNAIAERIGKEVAQIYSNQKIYILSGADKQKANLVKSRIEAAVKNPDISIVTSADAIQADKNMMTGQSAPVIAVLATDDDSDGADFTNRVIALTKEVAGMKAFSVYYHSSFEKKSGELAQANLVYLMDRKIDAEGDFEKEILADYKQKYCKTPPKYAIIGFDVMNDILSRENKNGEIFRQMGKVQTQLSTKFEYVRAKANGAYINNGYRVIRLLP